MKPTTKKYLIAGAIGIVTIAGALAYLQYQKLMDFTLKFKRIIVRNIAANYFNFDIVLDFFNKANMNFRVVSQEYDVYLNNIYITKLKSDKDILIKAKSSSEIPLNVELKPEDVVKNLNVSLLQNPKKYIIKIDAKLKVKFWFFKVNVPFTYSDTLENMMAKNP